MFPFDLNRNFTLSRTRLINLIKIMVKIKSMKKN